MGDPSARAARPQALADDGTVLLVEPTPDDRVEDNLNPVGRIFYGASTLLCTPNAVTRTAGTRSARRPAKRAAEVASRAGLTRFRRATETPFNLVFEARR